MIAAACRTAQIRRSSMHVRGPVIAYFCAWLAVVRVPGDWKTFVQPSNIGIM